MFLLCSGEGFDVPGIQSTDANFDFPLIAALPGGGVASIFDIETLPPVRAIRQTAHPRRFRPVLA